MTSPFLIEDASRGILAPSLFTLAAETRLYRFAYSEDFPAGWLVSPWWFFESDIAPIIGGRTGERLSSAAHGAGTIARNWPQPDAGTRQRTRVLDLVVRARLGLSTTAFRGPGQDQMEASGRLLRAPRNVQQLYLVELSRKHSPVPNLAAARRLFSTADVLDLELRPYRTLW